jgi:predicted transcriptional regulator
MAMDDPSAEIMANILDTCKNGCTKDKIIQETHLSHDQLRRITTEMVDRWLLDYIEVRGIYVTTDKGYMFLNRRQQSNTSRNNSKVFNKRLETKEEELVVDSIASKRNIIHRKVQLWTNSHRNEFAIKLTPDLEILATSDADDRNIFLAATNPNEDYIRVVAETDYFEPLKHGWEYTLRRLIEQYKQEISSISLRKIASTNNKGNNKPGEENNNTIPIRLIPYIKCRYCHSEFKTEEQKNEHELERHI